MSSRIGSFPSAREKADFLDASASEDCRLNMVRRHAEQFLAPGRGAYETARAIQHWVRDRISYVRDGRYTGKLREEFADSAEILWRGYDDCDGKARLFVALCRCVGIDARIRPVFDPVRRDEFTHVQAEIRFPGSVNMKGAEDGGWLVVELILAHCEIGQDVDTLARGPGGARILAGPPPPAHAPEFLHKGRKKT